MNPAVETEKPRTLPALSAAAQGRKKQRERKATATAVRFLLPNLVGFLIFTFFPVLFSLLMSFTNWSPKPAVQFEWVGLRNFIDLLGARPLGADQPGLLAIYVLCIALALGGGVGALWANMSGWRGTKPGGALLVVGGCTLLLSAARGGGQVLGLAGLLILVCGLPLALQDDEWKPGLGTVPAIMLTAGLGGFAALQGPMGAAYEARDPYFWQYLYNTVYMMLAIPLSIGGSLGIALLLNEDLPTGSKRQKTVGVSLCLGIGIVMGGLIWALGNPNMGLLCILLWGVAALGFGFNLLAFRTLFYLPTFTAGVALMILWKALYNPETGPINMGLESLFAALHLHATPPQWLGDVNWSKPAIMAMGVWTGIGGTNMLLYLAGLSNMPKELLEAADIDGATRWHKFRHVIWPQLAPTTFFISVMAIIGGLQGGFEQARVLTNGGPAGSTTSLSYYIYNKAFQDLDMGYASAISWVLFAIVFVATALNWKFGKGLEVD